MNKKPYSDRRWHDADFETVMNLKPLKHSEEYKKNAITITFQQLIKFCLILNIVTKTEKFRYQYFTEDVTFPRREVSTLVAKSAFSRRFPTAITT